MKGKGKEVSGFDWLPDTLESHMYLLFEFDIVSIMRKVRKEGESRIGDGVNFAQSGGSFGGGDHSRRT